MKGKARCSKDKESSVSHPPEACEVTRDYTRYDVPDLDGFQA